MGDERRLKTLLEHNSIGNEAITAIYWPWVGWCSKFNASCLSVTGKHLKTVKCEHQKHSAS